MMTNGKKRLQEIERELDKLHEINGPFQDKFINKTLLISEARSIRRRINRNKHTRKFLFDLLAPTCLFLGAFVFLVAIVG